MLVPATLKLEMSNERVHMVARGRFDKGEKNKGTVELPEVGGSADVKHGGSVMRGNFYGNSKGHFWSS